MESEGKQRPLDVAIRLLRSWDAILLSGILAAIVGMTAYLLWPQPEAVIALKPLNPASHQPALTALPAEAEIMVPAGEEGVSGETGAKPRPARKRRSSSARRKPAKPPVLNLNSAGAAQLQLLPGIGPKMAQRIIEYRKASGGFREIAGIMEVKGIGPKKFEKLRPYLKL